MIHSKDDNPNQILEFAKQYDDLCRNIGYRKPLISVPTTYNMISFEELESNNFNIVIYANHLLRAASKRMQQAAESIVPLPPHSNLVPHSKSLQSPRSCSLGE